MKEWKQEVPGGSLVYGIDERENTAELSRVGGRPTAMEVPAFLPTGEKVISIGRKAVLGKKQLRKVVLPGTVESIGEWAFASCSELRIITLPVAELGRGAFLECRNLQKAQVIGGEPGCEALLAEVLPDGEAEYLCKLGEVGMADWIRKWDARLLKILREPDAEGFSRQILCGEEDYGSTDLGAYESGRRMDKAELCMLRLLNDRDLPGGIRDQITEFLLHHISGAPAGDETWRMLRTRHGEDAEWISLFLRLGCVTDENRDTMIVELGEDLPELKSRLMKTATGSGAADFFAGLAL